MKQYTTQEQTAKLIALGFDKPNPSFYRNGATWIQCEGNYSISELLSFIPKEIENEEDDFAAIFQITAGWEIYYTTYSDIFYYFNNVELVDALYDMVVKLKEEGII